MIQLVLVLHLLQKLTLAGVQILVIQVLHGIIQLVTMVSINKLKITWLHGMLVMVLAGLKITT